MIKSISRVDLEASFTQVHQHTRNRNIGMILASRDDLTSEENRQRHTALKSDVRKAGYGLIDVEGRHGDEKSLLVVGKKGDDGGALLGYLKHLGKKYGQDSILHKPHNSEKASLHRTNETEKHKHIEVGSWRPNRTGEFHSLMKSRKPIASPELAQFDRCSHQSAGLPSPSNRRTRRLSYGRPRRAGMQARPSPRRPLVSWVDDGGSMPVPDGRMRGIWSIREGDFLLG